MYQVKTILNRLSLDDLHKLADEFGVPKTRTKWTQIDKFILYQSGGGKRGSDEIEEKPKLSEIERMLSYHTVAQIQDNRGHEFDVKITAEKEDEEHPNVMLYKYTFIDPIKPKPPDRADYITDLGLLIGKVRDLPGFAWTDEVRDKEQLIWEIENIEIEMEQQGKKLCTPFVASALRDAISRAIEHYNGAIPEFGTVFVMSTKQSAAKACYVNAAQQAGYTLLQRREKKENYNGPTAEELLFRRQ